MTKEATDKNIEELSTLLYDINNEVLKFETICDTLLPPIGQREVGQEQEDKVNSLREELISTLCRTFNLKKETNI